MGAPHGHARLRRHDICYAIDHLLLDIIKIIFKFAFHVVLRRFATREPNLVYLSTQKICEKQLMSLESTESKKKVSLVGVGSWWVEAR